MYNQALALANEFEVNCSAAEVLLSRLKVLLMQNLEEKQVPAKATKESESRDQGGGSQNVSKNEELHFSRPLHSCITFFHLRVRYENGKQLRVYETDNFFLTDNVAGPINLMRLSRQRF